MGKASAMDQAKVVEILEQSKQRWEVTEGHIVLHTFYAGMEEGFDGEKHPTWRTTIWWGGADSDISHETVYKDGKWWEYDFSTSHKDLTAAILNGVEGLLEYALPKDLLP